MKRLPDFEPGLGGIEGLGNLPQYETAQQVCEALETLAFDQGMQRPDSDEACFKRQITLQPDGIIARAGVELLRDSAWLDVNDPDNKISSPWCKIDVLASYDDTSDTRHAELTLLMGGFATLQNEKEQLRVCAVGEGYRYAMDIGPGAKLSYQPGHIIRSHDTVSVFEGRQEHIEKLLSARLREEGQALNDLNHDYATMAQARGLEELAEALISV